MPSPDEAVTPLAELSLGGERNPDVPHNPSTDLLVALGDNIQPPKALVAAAAPATAAAPPPPPPTVAAAAAAATAAASNPACSMPTGAVAGAQPAGVQSPSAAAVVQASNSNSSSAAQEDGKGGPEQDTEALDACVLAFWDLYTRAQLPAAIHLFQDWCEANHVPEQQFGQRLAALKGLDLAPLLERAAVVEQGIHECLDDSGWTLVQDGALRLMYRHTSGSTVHCFKGACLLPAPLTHVLAMAREFDLVKSWNSYITVSDIMGVNCEVDVTTYAAMWFPWPFAERDVFIQAVGVDHLDDTGHMAVSFGSPPGGRPPSGEPLPQGYDARTHLLLQPGSCMLLRPLPPDVPGGPTRTKATVVGIIDAGVGAYVPEAVVSFVLKSFAPFVYKAVLKTLAGAFQRDSDPLPTRMRQRPDLYQLMEERIAEYLADQPQPGRAVQQL